eukprot:Unigene10862_Nuclearia_a/m.33193 Unigene10862_Nuclearia_a/g.33193  ORF Unigene10862_Nuclearia_a/g.33193 Unigene10862_Nuclearia_a/m.33193 type:complete len:174 (+) Unigene10862_Nuclearia_a:74-595(+)
MRGSWRFSKWDPVLILAQIVALQATYYVVAGVTLAVLGRLFGVTASLAYLFDYRSLKSDYIFGWLIFASFVLAAAACAGTLLVLVARAKLCFDFAATLHLVHFVACLCFAGFPTSVMWWALAATSLGLMYGCGEYLCLQRELLPITLSGKDLSTSTGTGSGSGARADAANSSG